MAGLPLTNDSLVGFTVSPPIIFMYQKTTGGTGGESLVIADNLASWNRTSAPNINFGRTQYWKLGADHTPDKDSDR